jgi:NAD dependent epimerase/dehydratase
MTAWSGRKTLVTGAGGFIGSHLVEALVKEGAQVRALVRYNGRSDPGSLAEVDPQVLTSAEIVFGDVTDPFAVRQAVSGMDVVFHLAALIAIPYSYRAPASYVQTNVIGTLNVLEAVRDLEVPRMVHTSTSEVYGSARYTPIDEEHPVQAQSPYSASKIGADSIAESFYRAFGTPVATIRPFNTYGPRQSARAVIPTITSQVAAGLDPIVLGSLSPIRDLTYVDDTVRGFMAVAAAEGCVGRVTNVGSGVGVTVGALARTICELSGRPEVSISQDESRVRPPASEVMELVASTARAQELTGWLPTVTLEEGLGRTIEYVRERLSRYDVERYTT